MATKTQFKEKTKVGESIDPTLKNNLLDTEIQKKKQPLLTGCKQDVNNRKTTHPV